jgi:SAM-dependent methyltransferase
MSELCRLCGAASAVLGQLKSDSRVFLHCIGCDCVFVQSDGLLPADGERARYLEHNNDATPEYEKFLNRLAIPVGKAARVKGEGLDFGCGPVPVLSVLLAKQGFRMRQYDPFFFPDQTALKARYDFITCSEAAEHFHQPLKEFELLHKLMRPGGILGVMTQMRQSWEGFFQWYYPRDPTHVIFYSPRTMRWIADRFGWSAGFAPENVVIFRRDASSAFGAAT